jgi:hypothetical protein
MGRVDKAVLLSYWAVHGVILLTTTTLRAHRRLLLLVRCHRRRRCVVPRLNENAADHDAAKRQEPDPPPNAAPGPSLPVFTPFSLEVHQRSLSFLRRLPLLKGTSVSISLVLAPAVFVTAVVPVGRRAAAAQHRLVLFQGGVAAEGAGKGEGGAVVHQPSSQTTATTPITAIVPMCATSSTFSLRHDAPKKVLVAPTVVIVIVIVVVVALGGSTLSAALGAAVTAIAAVVV